jgi:hypothetical protein
MGRDGMAWNGMGWMECIKRKENRKRVNCIAMMGVVLGDCFAGGAFCVTDKFSV